MSYSNQSKALGNQSQSELAAIAIQAESSGMPSPFLSSSNNDQAHHVGLWAKRKGVSVVEVKKCRGHKWLLNRKYVLDFKKDNYEPSVEIHKNW